MASVDVLPAPMASALPCMRVAEIDGGAARALHERRDRARPVNDVTKAAVTVHQEQEQLGEPSEPMVFERRMGDTELSYYLPSRADGVNDMYVTIHAS